MNLNTTDNQINLEHDETAIVFKAKDAVVYVNTPLVAALEKPTDAVMLVTTVAELFRASNRDLWLELIRRTEIRARKFKNRSKH